MTSLPWFLTFKNLAGQVPSSLTSAPAPRPAPSTVTPHPSLQIDYRSPQPSVTTTLLPPTPGHRPPPSTLSSSVSWYQLGSECADGKTRAGPQELELPASLLGGCSPTSGDWWQDPPLYPGGLRDPGLQPPHPGLLCAPTPPQVTRSRHP